MRREARLKLEHGHLYPGVEPGRWESAAVLGEKVLACRLLQPSCGFVLSDRALNPGHFEFRGGSGPRIVAPERLVEDPRATAVDSALSITS
ncbi:MAG TPA: hypothetical protein VHR41_03460 [Gemmatimonadales bacterium]|jgi:hypothetical protein|nr:hypothetical protein [Gemmatimonadales bacterium]